MAQRLIETFEVGESVLVIPWENYPYKDSFEENYGTGVGMAIILAPIEGGHHVIKFGFISNRPNERTSVACQRIRKLTPGHPASPPTASLVDEITLS